MPEQTADCRSEVAEGTSGPPAFLCENMRGQPAGRLPGAATGTEELPVFTTSCTALVPTVPTSAQRVPWLTL